MPSLPDDLSKLDLELPPAQYEPATPPADVGNEPVMAENLANGEETEQAQPENESVPRRHSRGWFAIPAWAVSLILHVGMLLILAAVSLEPIQEALAVLIVSGASSEPSMLEEFDVESAAAPMAVSSEDMEFVPQVTPSQSFVSEVVSEIPLEMTVATELSQLKMPSMTQQLTPTDILSAQIDSISKSLNSRSSKMKREMLERYGGNPDSEKAVALALKWLALHQLPDGSWTFAHSQVCRGQCDLPGSLARARNAATGLALLPFLGAGQTHMEGEYKAVVRKGLSFLLESMKVERNAATGSWHGGEDNMYGHGIASIALCEAYAMTGDESLATPAQLCLNYISYAQNPDGGGWQYSPRVGGDTSVVGWQLMALKSGAMGGLEINPITLRKAAYFLDSVQMNDGAFYGYDKPDASIDGRLATSACGLLCRMYMGWPKTHPAMIEGTDYLNKIGPNATNVYYNYYATQVMKQMGGDKWESWNSRMRDQVVKSQVKEGHAEGSWSFSDMSAGNPSEAGGRLYLTAMNAMILEVYYRYMPVYAEQTEEDAFKL